jgi:triosephosphate isomerase
MADRRPYIAGNWKMNKTGFEAEDFVFALLPQIAGEDIAEVVICAPFTTLTNVIDSSRGTRIKVAAQNMHQAESGAYTGEISAGQLKDLDVRAVVLGHSERRQYFAETDEALREKVPVALANELEPILCVGETDEQREAGETEAVLKRQVEVGLADVAPADLPKVVVAYEPVWAIGTGKVATNEIAQEACGYIRGLLAAIDAEAAAQVRILYGGSMKPDNATELLAQPDIDGGLIGGASLQADDFAKLVAAGDAA